MSPNFGSSSNQFCYLRQVTISPNLNVCVTKMGVIIPIYKVGSSSERDNTFKC